MNINGSATGNTVAKDYDYDYDYDDASSESDSSDSGSGSDAPTPTVPRSELSLIDKLTARADSTKPYAMYAVTMHKLMEMYKKSRLTELIMPARNIMNDTTLSIEERVAKISDLPLLKYGIRCIGPAMIVPETVGVVSCIRCRNHAVKCEDCGSEYCSGCYTSCDVCCYILDNEDGYAADIYSKIEKLLSTTECKGCDNTDAQNVCSLCCKTYCNECAKNDCPCYYMTPTTLCDILDVPSLTIVVDCDTWDTIPNRDMWKESINQVCPITDKRLKHCDGDVLFVGIYGIYEDVIANIVSSNSNATFHIAGDKSDTVLYGVKKLNVFGLDVNFIDTLRLSDG